MLFKYIDKTYKEGALSENILSLYLTFTLISLYYVDTVKFRK